MYCYLLCPFLLLTLCLLPYHNQNCFAGVLAIRCGVPSSSSTLKTFSWLTSELQTWTTYSHLSLRCWRNSWSELLKCSDTQHSTKSQLCDLARCKEVRGVLVFFHRLNYTQWSNVLLLEQELPHCCEVKTLLGEQEGSSRATEFIGQAEGVCVLMTVLSKRVHFHGI